MLATEERERELHAASKALGQARLRLAIAKKQASDAVARLVKLYECVTCGGSRKVLGLACPVCASEFFIHKHTIDYQHYCNGCWYKRPKVMTKATRVYCWVDDRGEVSTSPWCDDCAVRKHAKAGVMLPFNRMEGL